MKQHRRALRGVLRNWTRIENDEGDEEIDEEKRRRENGRREAKDRRRGHGDKMSGGEGEALRRFKKREHDTGKNPKESSGHAQSHEDIEEDRAGRHQRVVTWTCSDSDL